ncbi:CPXCG motif-containing cysteine-rich protein [Sansalvadorimonas verongulae]|uniref:CPXCG motif-containing cysteine-rich protein n=1 Tax=Sansalvadorimonas verongulae TaxID=2172824 RepID=UPI0012BBDEC8|nr:CPXCG motif-containing cysteine-rich protein [Sansalvadorimonas verongulae]MTI13291.1 CPXCG motif-containing cysteine-rich protein [Sansalvadorimonas verongulae]
MDAIQQAIIFCPYCGERIELVVNSEDAGTSYIEDCQVCCQPMTIVVELSDDETLSVQARHENEA